MNIDLPGTIKSKQRRFVPLDLLIVLGVGIDLLWVAVNFSAFYFEWNSWGSGLLLAGLALFLNAVLGVTYLRFIFDRLKEFQRSGLWVRLSAAYPIFFGLLVLLPFKPGFYVRNQGNKARFKHGVGLEKLQTWAVQELDVHTGEILFQLVSLDQKSYEPSVLPEIQKLHPSYLSITGREGKELCIRLLFGGGFYRWGVLVGRPTFVPGDPKSNERRLLYWRPGMYGFYEEN